MPKLFPSSAVLVIAAFFIVLNASSIRAQEVERMEIGANYSFVHTNAPPGNCGCFQMNGGAGWFAYNFMPELALVGEVGGEYASNIKGATSDLRLTSFLAGPHYSWHHYKRYAPFGQVLLGEAHASGALTPAASGLAGSANAFAMAAGGGLDLEIAPRWRLRVVQMDYYLTRFNNGINDHQNNLRVGVGIAYRFGQTDK